VTDNLTGLIWIRLNDNIHRTWEESLDYANNLDRCGYSNWRLPNINELASMIHNGEPDIAVWLNTSPPDYFIGIESYPYWSSTTDRAARSAAMVVDLWDGSIGSAYKASDYYAWAVHLSGPVLTVLKTGEGSGTVTSTPPGIACGCDCSEVFLQGTEVTLTAVAEPGSIFEGWSGACTGTGTCTITLNTDTEVTASFSRQALLTVLKIGNGSGTVTSTPPGIDCGPDCSETYLKGTEVTLTAVPEPGSIFQGWSGACTGTETCTITLNTDTEVTATFSKEVLLTVLKTGTGSGTVTSLPPGLDCGLDCSDALREGTTVILIAVADTGSVFEGWSGACTGTGLCTITLNTDTEVTASFSYEPLLLTVLKTGTGSGTVTSLPPGIDCGSDCSEAFLPGTEVTLMGVAEPGSTFEGWSGACTGTGICIIILNTDTEITASFITPSSQCTYSLSPKTYTFGVKGGTLGIAVTASANACPQPSVDSAENWIHTELTGWNGKRGTVRVVVDPSYSSVKRLSTVGIGNATFTAIQKKRSCTPGDVPPTFTPSSALWDANGGTDSFTISFAPNAAVDCAWSAQPDGGTSWASTSSSGAGNGTVEYSVAQNLSPEIRKGKINVTLVQKPLAVYSFKLRQLD
jgi:hypothetical protein